VLSLVQRNLEMLMADLFRFPLLHCDSGGVAIVLVENIAAQCHIISSGYGTARFRRSDALPLHPTTAQDLGPIVLNPNEAWREMFLPDKNLS